MDINYYYMPIYIYSTIIYSFPIDLVTRAHRHTHTHTRKQFNKQTIDLKNVPLKSKK